MTLEERQTLTDQAASGETMWWGYLHSNGSIQLKRWFGDHKDYTEDCENNPFTKIVITPFGADTDFGARLILQAKIDLATAIKS